MGSYSTFLGRIEIQTDGVAGSAGWVHVPGVGDCTLSMSRTKSNLPRRGSQFKTSLAGQIESGIEGDLVWDDASTEIAAMEAAFLANTPIGVKFLDKASGRSFTLDCLVTKWDLPQPEDAVQMVGCELTPYYDGTDPVLG